ncbi:MAG: hypothetical protein RMY64_10435 [Nostoc sp. DedQUE08]|uniref:hypothetical protein n=1 Tax=Nostoc sp. DedQUE08 TaxID=3075393 RepID=UPI002AD43CF2|nr:hypothetical protein [Nostoc sp. DedQUE08]MDZ8066042.1 hypothetical protein [Nostoc sp. DedQUE08]
MNIWIVTTGNSDVQLKYDYDQNKWQKRYRVVRSQLSNHLFEPSRPKNARTEEPYTVPARVLGMVYSTDLDIDTYNNLHFPLLDTFTKGLQGKNRPDKIFVILTNQEDVFSAKDKTDYKCPYWQDTCTLQPILEKYFQSHKELYRLKPSEDIKYLELKPESKEQGLDNWDKCFILVQQLVQREISTLHNKTANVYVSHQAGTPAIFSAVQFASLAKFDKQVKFLVSNEYEPGNSIHIPSSNYLKGIKLQEAKALLERYDYSGVQEILTNILKNREEPLNSQEQRISELLTMAISWNCAKFEDFAKARGTIAQEHIQKWWWMGYEAAYLAVVRLEQGNTVDALFHSFRAVEGLIRYKAGPTREDISKLIPKVFPNWESNSDMKIFNDHTRLERNILFHRLSGLKEEEVFAAWNTSNKDKENWKKSILGCLNFVSGEKFTSLKKASLMYQVEQELQAAISNYELKTF